MCRDRSTFLLCVLNKAGMREGRERENLFFISLEPFFSIHPTFQHPFCISLFIRMEHPHAKFSATEEDEDGSLAPKREKICITNVKQPSTQYKRIYRSYYITFGILVSTVRKIPFSCLTDAVSWRDGSVGFFSQKRIN